MFAIVCFMGLVLMALGASSVEAGDVHLQTLSVKGQLYSVPSSTCIVLDDDARPGQIPDLLSICPQTLPDRQAGMARCDDARADAGMVSLSGPVALIAAPTLTIQGLVIDCTDARFRAGDGRPISAAAFFARLRLNQEVHVDAAAWHADTGVLTGGELTVVATGHARPPSRAATTT